MQILSLGKLFRYYEKIASKYDGTKCTYVGTVTFSFENQRFIYETNWLSGETIECDFEGKRIPIPEYYDAILKKSYGDYMTPVQEPTNHGDVLFSSTIPYGQFIRDHYEELKNGWYKCRKKQ